MQRIDSEGGYQAGVKRRPGKRSAARHDNAGLESGDALPGGAALTGPTVWRKGLIQKVGVRLALIVGRASAAPPGITVRDYSPAIACPVALRLPGLRSGARVDSEGGCRAEVNCRPGKRSAARHCGAALIRR
ncbi:MAG: hypothetical protein E7B59_03005 [Enterobacteriaceae bacterium]|nr:hypothetical protein [Enterobacteriaceae bacterium]